MSRVAVVGAGTMGSGIAHLLAQLVAAGRLGKKSGRGFHVYRD